MRQAAKLRDLAEVLEAVGATKSKKAKVALLATYLRGLGPDDAEFAARVAAGRSSQRGSADEARVGYSTLLDVIMELTGAKQGDVSDSYLRHGDLGEVAEELLAKKRVQTLFQEPLSLSDLREGFDKLRSTKGKGSSETRFEVAKSLLLMSSPLESKYIVKALTGEMRTGIVEGLLEEAIAEAFSVPKGQAAKAHMAVGDIGALARAASTGEVGAIRIAPFRPVNFMLAEPLGTPGEVASHFGKTAYAEYKYDGVRAQVHRHGGEVRLYSRRLEEITASFPEVVGAFPASGDDFILDGEVVAYASERPLPFQLLQRRLRRLDGFDEAAREAPVVFFAFDILLRGEEETVELPLRERRRMLDAALGSSGARRARSEDVTTEEDVGVAFRRSRDLGYEGLVVKDPDSTYCMGKRGSGWVKLKEELDTIDAVIVAAEYGHGKRVGVISDYTFAVRDGEALKTVGKAYSGLTDSEIEEMTKRLKETTVKDMGYRRLVRPEIVVEVAFDSVQKSGRHDSGYALRFPRIKRIRTDKSASDVDTLDRVREIFSRQKLKVEGR